MDGARTPPAGQASGAVRRLFREEVIRLWGGHSLLRAGAWLLLVLALQLLLTFLTTRSNIGPRGVVRFYSGPESQLLSFFGLYSGAAPLMFPGGARFSSAGPWISTSAWLVHSVPQAAFHFLFPAYAAAAFVRARKRGDDSEWLAAGVSPWQLLTVRSIALLMPFLVLAAGALALSLYALNTAPAAGPGRRAGILTATSQARLLSLAVAPALWITGAMIAAAIAAQHRMVFRAAAACYLVELLALPLASLGLVLVLQSPPGSLTGSNYEARVWSRVLILLALHLTLLGALLPLAVRCMRAAGPGGGPSTRCEV